MDKAILVIDMPSRCAECELCYDNYGDCYFCAANDKQIDEHLMSKAKMNWCPLKPVPEKRDIDKKKCSDPFYEFEYEYGWNACLEEIMDT